MGRAARLLPAPRGLLVPLAVAAAYYLLGRLVFSWFDGASGTATFFPPAGVTLAALVLTPRRRWPAVLAAAAAAELTLDLTHDLSLVASLGYAVANTVEPTVGALLLTTLVPRVDLGRTRHLAAFVACSVVAAPALGGVLGATNTLLNEDGLPWLRFVGQWWVGDGVGVLVVGGAILAWRTAPVPRPRRLLGLVEPPALIVAAIVSTGAVFWLDRVALVYAPIALVLWIAFRVGTRGVAVAGAGMAFAAAEATARGHTFWSTIDMSPATGLVYLQLAIAVVIVTGLALAAEIAQRDRSAAESEQAQRGRRAAERAAELNERLRDLSDALARAESAAEVTAVMRRQGLVPLEPPPGAAREVASAEEVAARHPPPREQPPPGSIVAFHDGAGLAAPVTGEPEPADVLFAERAAQAVAHALERARLRDEERVARERLERLYALTAALGGATTVDDVSQVIVRFGVDAAHADAGVVGLVTGEGAWLDARVWSGYDDTTITRRVKLDRDAPFTEAVREAQPVLLRTAEERARLFPRSASDTTGSRYRAWASLPLSGANGAALGVVHLAFGSEQSFPEQSRAVLAAIASQGGQALERALLQEAEAAARARAELLAEVSGALDAAARLHARAEALLDVLVPRLADYGTVERFADEGTSLLAVRHRSPERLPALRALRERRRLVGRASPSRAPQLLTDVTPEIQRELAPDEDAAALLRELGVRSHMAVPLLVEGEPVAELVLGICRPGRAPFTRADLELVVEVASRAALALENARLWEEEHQIAVRLQRALLPAGLAEARNVAVAGRYEAGHERLEVGGDWYDAIGLPEGRIGLAVGDVVGHGLSAAAAMGQLRTALAALAPRVAGPGELLADVDEFAGTVDEADFATVFYAVLDPDTGRLCYASAGHPPALVVSPHGETTFLEGGRSLPLCGMGAGPRAEETMVLEPGDTLVAYSDGLVERRGEPLSEGLDRLARIAAELAAGSVDELCTRLVDGMTAGAHLRDDVAVLCVRFDGPAAERLRFRFPARPEQLRLARDAIRGWLAARGVPADVEAEVVLVAGEACSNAVEHAYAGRAAGDVELCAWVDGDDALVVSVRDFGSWREPRPSDGRGRGAGIMQALGDEVAVEQTGDGTLVTVRRRVAPTVPTAS